MDSEEYKAQMKKRQAERDEIGYLRVKSNKGEASGEEKRKLEVLLTEQKTAIEAWKAEAPMRAAKREARLQARIAKRAARIAKMEAQLAKYKGQ